MGVMEAVAVPTMVQYVLFVTSLMRACFIATVGAQQTEDVVPPERREYCLTETFKAQCGEGEVILIAEARFGRIRLGRCLTKNFGYLGCSRDVVAYLDSKCGGRRQCEFSVSDADLVRTKPCPPDLASYLEASYICVPVLQQTEAVCSGRKEVKVTGTAQYILGGSQLEAIGEEAGCTYYLMAAPGQRLTISIINLSLNSSSALAGEDSEFSYGLLQLAHCTGFASVEEPDLGHRTDICASDRRASVAYESQTDRLLLRFVEETTRELFLIKVQGCTSLVVPEGATARSSGETLVILCNHSGESSVLNCEDNTWRGHIHNCTSVESHNPSSHREADISLPPLGISIVIIFGVALVTVVYVAIMVVCVVYLKRRRRLLSRHAVSMDDWQEQQGGGGGKALAHIGRSSGVNGGCSAADYVPTPRLNGSKVALSPGSALSANSAVGCDEGCPMLEKSATATLRAQKQNYLDLYALHSRQATLPRQPQPQYFYHRHQHQLPATANGEQSAYAFGGGGGGGGGHLTGSGTFSARQSPSRSLPGESPLLRRGLSENGWTSTFSPQARAILMTSSKPTYVCPGTSQFVTLSPDVVQPGDRQAKTTTSVPQINGDVTEENSCNALS